MTNANDFRRYSTYVSSTSALVNSFDVSRGSARTAAAPDIAPRSRREKERERDLKVRKGVGIKNRNVLIKEQRAARIKAIRISLVAVLCLAMIAVVVNSFAVKNQLTRQIAVQETEIANAQSENISLQSELNSLVSMSMIDKYAVEKLKMTKIKSSQIQYMDVAAFKQKRVDSLNKKAVDSGAKRLKQKQGINK